MPTSLKLNPSNSFRISTNGSVIAGSIVRLQQLEDPLEQQSSSETPSSSTVVILAVVVPIGAILVLSAVVFALFWRARKNPRKQPEQVQSDEPKNTDYATVAFVKPMSSTSKWEIDFREIELGEVLGSGACVLAWVFDAADSG